MTQLAIDTATEILSVALERDGPDGPRRLVMERDTGLRHARLLMPLVDTLLSQAGVRVEELDLISCLRGPGSFTGLRIGMATAKGVAAAVAAHLGTSRAPVVSVPTLDVIAARVPPVPALVMPVIDGRKGRFYTALYRRGRRISEDLDLTPQALLSLAASLSTPDDNALIVTGPHASGFVGKLTANLPVTVPELVMDPAARSGCAAQLLGLARIASEAGYDAEDQGPWYVRESDAEAGRRDGAG